MIYYFKRPPGISCFGVMILYITKRNLVEKKSYVNFCKWAQKQMAQLGSTKMLLKMRKFRVYNFNGYLNIVVKRVDVINNILKHKAICKLK